MFNIKTGVIDRISDGKIVIIFEEEKEEILINQTDYPHLREGLWVNVYVTDNNIISDIQINTEKTEEFNSNTQDLLSRLKRRSKSKYKR